MSTATAPIALRVTRYRCPHCPRSYAKRSGAVDHINRCWHNPDARGCKTCRHYQPASAQCCGDVGAGCFTPWCRNLDDLCGKDVSLAASETCETCGGHGDVIKGGGSSECPTCSGYGGSDGPVRKAGPRVHCDEWEAALRAGDRP